MAAARQFETARNAMKQKKDIPHLDMRRFHPIVAAAAAKVSEFVAAGAVVTSVERDRVLLRRQESMATVDSCGRVTWSAALGRRKGGA
jgi:hypothetical protein